MKLITETIDNLEVIVEEVGGKKRYYLQGIFMQAETKNRNGRVYPISILDKAVQVYTKDFIKENRAVGELNHPKGPEIDYDRSCIKIEELHREGNDFIGKALVLDTEKGITVQKLLEANVKIGVSSRALGTTRKENGIAVVNNDLVIRAIDVVSDPSAPDAFPHGIMEGKDWNIVDDGSIVETSLLEDEILASMQNLFENLKKGKGKF